MVDPPTRRLCAIVAADLEGFARLVSHDEEGAIERLQQAFTRVIRPSVTDHGGSIVKTTGDGFLAEFASVVDALRASMAIQQTMWRDNHELPRDERLAFRIGLTAGDVIDIEGDLFGDVVNVAARLEAIAEAGGICLSEAARKQVSGRLSIGFEDLGLKALKNIEQPIRAFRVTSLSRATVQSLDDAADLPEIPKRPSLAILPFRTLCSDADDQMIAHGISLGIQTLLVQLSNIFFVNACQHSSYRTGQVSAREALADMPVQFAIEGDVQRVGARLRVTVRVSDLISDAVLFAEVHDSSLKDVFKLQDDIAIRIAQALSVELVGGPLARDFTGDLTSDNAWEHFLRGINHFYAWNKAAHAAARPHFEALAAADPENGLGPCYLSLIEFADGLHGWNRTPDEAFSAAEDWARKAVASESGNNGLGHAVLGALSLKRRAHDEALAMGRKAVAYRSNCPFALHQLGEAETFGGRVERGIRYTREGLSVRMQHPPQMVDALAIATRDHGEPSRAVAIADAALASDPGFTDAMVTRCSALALAGDAEAARRSARDIRREAPGFSVQQYLQRMPYRVPETPARLGAVLKTAGLPA